MTEYEIPEAYRLAAAMRTCGDPDCDDPRHLKKPYRGESGILDLTDAELDEFIGTMLGLRAGTDLREHIRKALATVNRVQAELERGWSRGDEEAEVEALRALAVAVRESGEYD